MSSAIHVEYMMRSNMNGGAKAELSTRFVNAATGGLPGSPHSNEGHVETPLLAASPGSGPRPRHRSSGRLAAYRRIAA